MTRANKLALTPNECYQLILTDATELASWAIDTAKQQFKKGQHYGAYGFQVCILNSEHVFNLCPALKKISDVSKIHSFGVNKMSPTQYYRLHTDTDRVVTINMLLNQQDSFCAFVDTSHNETIKLDYKLNNLYLFNMQIPHTIFNFSGDRYLFATKFASNKALLPYRYLQKQLRKVELL